MYGTPQPDFKTLVKIGVETVEALVAEPGIRGQLAFLTGPNSPIPDTEDPEDPAVVEPLIGFVKTASATASESNLNNWGLCCVLFVIYTLLDRGLKAFNLQAAPAGGTMASLRAHRLIADYGAHYAGSLPIPN